MPTVLLSAQLLSRILAEPPAKKVDYYDKAIPGFILEFRPSGGATYYLRYRDRRGRQRQYKIGDQKSLTLEKARQAAKVLRSRVILGESPIEERATIKSIPTFAEFVSEVYLPHIKVTRRNTSSDVSHLKRHLLPRIGHLPLNQVRQQHVLACHDELLRTGYAKATANRSMVITKIIFNLAKRLGTPGAEVNPVAGIKFADPQNARERYLTKEETQRLLRALDESENSQLRFIVPLLLLTGARKREILDATWDEINLEKRYLRVPLSKSGKPRLIPLSSAAMEVLQRVPRTEGCPYVVPNPDTGKPYVSVYASWDRARKKAGLQDVRLHDLRHSYASSLVNAGTSIYVVSKVLGHSQIKNTMRYSHLSQETLVDAAERAAAAFAP